VDQLRAAQVKISAGAYELGRVVALIEAASGVSTYIGLGIDRLRPVHVEYDITCPASVLLELLDALTDDSIGHRIGDGIVYFVREEIGQEDVRRQLESVSISFDADNITPQCLLGVVCASSGVPIAGDCIPDASALQASLLGPGDGLASTLLDRCQDQTRWRFGVVTGGILVAYVCHEGTARDESQMRISVSVCNLVLMQVVRFLVEPLCGQRLTIDSSCNMSLLGQQAVTLEVADMSIDVILGMLLDLGGYGCDKTPSGFRLRPRSAARSKERGNR
jgi:hypothetical protein